MALVRPVQYAPCSVAELFLRGYLTDEDILPGGNITNSTRIRAERTYAEQVQQEVPRQIRRTPRPSSARPSTVRPSTVRPSTIRPSTARPSIRDRGTVSHVERLRVRRNVTDRDYVPRPVNLDNCCICLSRVKEYACVPCYHMCICVACKDRVDTCPLCRANVTRIVKIFV